MFKKIRYWFLTREIKKHFRKRSINSTFLKPPENYKLKFQDDFKGKFSDNWKRSQPWGWYHPEILNQYYDRDGECSYLKNGNLVLETKHRPIETYIKKLNKKVLLDYKIGLIHSKENYKYGWFEATIKFPEKPSLWPAFWMYSSNAWPPEIDIVEAYSNLGKRYPKHYFFNLIKKDWQKFQPNLHYGSVEKNTKNNFGGYATPIYKAPKRYVQFVLHWERDFIKIFYDGILVMENRDKKILKDFNKPGDKFYLLLNNGVSKNPKQPPEDSKMMVKNVKIYQK